MALTDNQLKRIKQNLDFVTQEEDLTIPPSEEESFWNWFKLNASALQATNPNNLESIDYEGRCFDIAQKITRNRHKEYYEGFLMLQNNTIFHGFNFSDDKVEDYTAKKNLKTFRESNGSQLPSEYYGLKIPDILIESENSTYIDKDQINIPSLLYKHFKNNTK